MDAPVTCLAAYLATMNVVTFALFCADKWKAQHGRWRIPERVLLGFCAAGGALGGYLGMRIAHHKTRKPRFSVGVPVILVAWVAALWYLLASGTL